MRPIPTPNRTSPMMSWVRRRESRSQGCGHPGREVDPCGRHEADQDVLGTRFPKGHHPVGGLERIARIAELGRDLDLGAIPSLLLAGLLEPVKGGDESPDISGEVGVIPLIGPSSGEWDGASRPRASDDEWRPGLLHGLWLEAGRPDGPMLAFEVEHLLCHQAVQDLECLVQQLEPLPIRRQVDAERLVLPLMPAGANPQLESPVRHVIERDRLFGQHRRMPERVGADHGPESDAAGHGGEPTEESPAVHDREALLAPGRIEMVVEPDHIPEPVSIGFDPNLAYLGPVVLLGPELERMTERTACHHVPAPLVSGTSGRSSAGVNPRTIP
jgi:hypothetical protein